MGQGVDNGCGCRARMKVEPFFGEVRYKKGEQRCPLFVTPNTLDLAPIGPLRQYCRIGFLKGNAPRLTSKTTPIYLRRHDRMVLQPYDRERPLCGERTPTLRRAHKWHTDRPGPIGAAAPEDQRGVRARTGRGGMVD
jgi:hypothetical protein